MGEICGSVLGCGWFWSFRVFFFRRCRCKGCGNRTQSAQSQAGRCANVVVLSASVCKFYSARKHRARFAWAAAFIVPSSVRCPAVARQFSSAARAVHYSMQWSRRPPPSDDQDGKNSHYAPSETLPMLMPDRMFIRACTVSWCYTQTKHDWRSNHLGPVVAAGCRRRRHPCRAGEEILYAFRFIEQAEINPSNRWRPSAV